MLARSFFGHWEDVGLGNLDKTKLEALLACCLHIQGVIPADGSGFLLHKHTLLIRSLLT